MKQAHSRTVVIILWSAPLLLMATMVAANVALAAAYARLLGGLGLAPAAGAAFWALYFGALGLTNLPALAAAGRWRQAEAREHAALAEVRAAVRWPTHLDRWQPTLWPDVPAPGVARPRPPIAALRSEFRALRRHLPYAGLLLGSLAGPVLLAGLLAGV
jgi:hypothetical protein